MATNESTATVYAFKPVRHDRTEVDRVSLPGCAVQRHAGTVEVVALGAAAILRLIEWDEQREEDHESDPDAHPVPVLNDYYRSALLRLVATNMEMLADETARIKQWAFTSHTPEGKAEELAQALRLVRHCESMAAGHRA